jgi:hypothetical protein
MEKVSVLYLPIVVRPAYPLDQPQHPLAQRETFAVWHGPPTRMKTHGLLEGREERDA